jgi:hypothetical protein
MAGKITEMTAASQADLTDLLEATKDPSGTPLTRSLSLTQIKALISVWGQITGTLSNQTDLQSALNAKAASIHAAQHTDGTDDIQDATALQKGLMTSAQAGKLVNIEPNAEVNNISDANATDLTDSGESALHYHDSDRARGNHTGSQLASTISDFNTAVAANSAVTANTAKVTNATHTGDVTGSDALTIGNDKVTYPKMQNVVADDRILGNVSGAGGEVAELTAAQVNTMLGAGKINVATYAANQTLTAEQCDGTYVIYVTGAATITLPAIATGLNVTIITIGAVAVSIDPNASDKIWLDGAPLDDGDKITNTSTAGDIAVLTYYSADGWHASTNSWIDGGV